MSTFRENFKERRLALVGNALVMAFGYIHIIPYAMYIMYRIVNGGSVWVNILIIIIPAIVLAICEILYEAPVTFAYEDEWTPVNAPQAEDVGQSTEQFGESMRELEAAGMIKIDENGLVSVRADVMAIPLDDPCWD